ncbi:MAG: DUF3854 domain-containing protein [Candidatus Dormibacteria bacterium]
MPAPRENYKERRSWQRVTRSHPCPVCGKPDWCAVATDGQLVRCQRVEAGAFQTATDKTGQTYYLHRLNGEQHARIELPPANGAGACRADADTLHAIYGALLGGLALSAAHCDNLRKRGLPDSEIERRLYRSLPVQGRAAKARQLAERFGAETLLSVPGFIVKDKDGRKYLTIAGAAGMLVPVRDTADRIVALKVRRDDAGDGPRYSYLSSAKYGGPGPGSPVHVPLGVTAHCQTVRLTEGELKADVATVLSGPAASRRARKARKTKTKPARAVPMGTPTLGLPGVAGWKAALPLLRDLQTEIVRVAYDADAADKPAVARALAACVEGLAAEGFAVAVERWDAADGKGIDDLLAAGKTPEVLEGDAARAYVAEVLALATADEPPPPPSPLDRLGDVLAENGVEGLYGDGELLDALARLAESDPAAYAGRRTQLKREGASVRDLDKALAGRRAAVRAELPPRVAEAGYRISGGRLVRDQLTGQGAVEVPLSNFTARIVAETTRDDGAERSVSLSVEGALCDGRPLPRVEVPAADFADLGWILPAWGARAVVYAGKGTADHLRAAMQLLSADVAARTVWCHLGWRRIGERWVYLHVGGAIGADSAVDGIEVSPPDALALYVLPAPPSDEQLRRAVRASLALLDFGPPRLAYSLLSAVYRAVLGNTDFALHLAGTSGVYKSELSALMQQHFGTQLDARHLPASWASTGNSLEAIAFAAKDALLVVDDLVTSGNVADVSRLHREADRLLRAQGNTAGRQRLRADGSLRPAKPPRGLILSTGEDVPRGQSLRARLLILEASAGDFGPPPPVNPALTERQRDAAEGLYAASMAAFLAWLAPQYETIHSKLAAERSELREHAAGDGQHARTPGIVADLALGLRYLLDFAAAAGAIDAAKRAALWERGWAALCEAGAAQVEHGRAADPVGQFLRLLSAALASGRAHVAAADGCSPETPSAWGWRREEVRDGPAWRPQGRRVGWLDGEALYLEPEASYAAAQGMAGEQGESLSVSPRTLWKRLRERGLLASWDERRQRNTIRRKLEGVEAREVLNLPSVVLYACGEPSKPSISGESPEKMDYFVGRSDGPVQEPSTETVQRNGQKYAGTAPNGRFGRSEAGIEAHALETNSPGAYTAPGRTEEDTSTPFDEGEI